MNTLQKCCDYALLKLAYSDKQLRNKYFHFKKSDPNPRFQLDFMENTKVGGFKSDYICYKVS